MPMKTMPTNSKPTNSLHPRTDPERVRLVVLCTTIVAPRFRALFDGVRDHIGRRVDGCLAFGRLDSPIHGLDHWLRVGCLAVRLAELTGRTGLAKLADERPVDALALEPVLLAAFFHDSGRLGEWLEPGHGEAGARVLESLAPALGLSPDAVATAAHAIRLHEYQLPLADAPDLATRVLANADRLDRIRFGERVRPALMYDDGAWSTIEKASWWLAEWLDWQEAGERVGVGG